ncbi:UDP-N-acetylmuramoyl-tripeptide--D-alanyl-D-alanine ligase [Paenibacillus sp. CAA11]|uniref:UDP-N-acetylmuramoyl-tripeptide--D-alanyl-D- alanine ligase n=1 Tax=Paenibacillus sp. CAA11 TaxID=1532905 RepID=UPI000D3DB85C|nr:UDP-N-acetylmuramoyl-tripeptide--D-alanyl-D-alanine ligase [Paenibacillus sp. CAA11]AWB46978.1 UDP-N-acetylmuramoyl-tripeptide--D-alanyl-D-alanine ligase [Paenibacillus sp. CAA11]
MKRTLTEVSALCEGELAHREDAAIMIQGVTTDSRKPGDRCLFIPLVGERFDGHDYTEEVLRSGAAASLWQRDHGTPPAGPVILVEDTLVALQKLAAGYLRESGARVIGITGSNGKTTTKDMVTSLLSTTYKVHKTEGNFNNHIGLPLTLLSMPEQSDFVVLEMGMSARGEIRLLSELAHPETAIITNIGESHLEQLGSREEIARAKTEIAAGMPAGGLLLYNGDEPLIPAVLDEPSTVKPEGLNGSTFGLGEGCSIHPTGMMFHTEGTIFTDNTSTDSQPFKLPLLGKHNVLNALGAIACARHYGISEENLRLGLEKLKLTGMRIELIEGVSGITILNDAYNASPTSMKAALEVLGSMKGFRKKIAVLGDMLELGKDEIEMHRNIGRSLTPQTVDLLFVYGQLGAAIAEGASEVLPAASVAAYNNKSELIEDLSTRLHPKDVVLVKASRGMRLEEVVEAVRNQPIIPS